MSNHSLNREREPLTIEDYCNLGKMIYLDMGYWHGKSEEKIERYYDILLRHIQSKTYHLVSNAENIPIGYATWNAIVNDKSRIEITRQTAPYGDHLCVQRSLRIHLPEVTAAFAMHARSARLEQTAW